MRFDNLAPRYHYLLSQEAVLGWDQLFYGRFTWAWCTLQEDHFHNSETPNAKMKGERWLVDLITIVWSHMHENWEACNDDLHGIDMAMREAAKYKMAKRETMELYVLEAFKTLSLFKHLWVSMHSYKRFLSLSIFEDY